MYSILRYKVTDHCWYNRIIFSFFRFFPINAVFSDPPLEFPKSASEKIGLPPPPPPPPPSDNQYIVTYKLKGLNSQTVVLRTGRLLSPRQLSP